MAKYIAGDSVLRLEGRTDAPVQPGETFEFEFAPELEAALLAGGAIRQAPAAPAVSPSPTTRSTVTVADTAKAEEKS